MVPELHLLRATFANKQVSTIFNAKFALFWCIQDSNLMQILVGYVCNVCNFEYKYLCRHIMKTYREKNPGSHVGKPGRFQVQIYGSHGIEPTRD